MSILAITRMQAKVIFKNYHWKVYRGKQTKDGFLAETNKGKKQLHLWETKEIVKWSHIWREALAASGYRPVERLVPTKDKQPYLVHDGVIIGASDYVTGKNPDYRREKDCVVLGRILGRLHRVLYQQEEQPDADGIKRWWSHQRRGQPTLEDKAKQAVKKLENLEENHNTATLQQRLVRAASLHREVAKASRQFPLTHANFSNKNVIRTARSWYLQGLHNPALAPLHTDTYHVVREIYKQGGWNLNLVSAFFRGYQKERELPHEERVYLLSMLVFPQDVWELIRRSEDDEGTEGSLKIVFRAQEKWDQLSSWMAREIDRSKEVSGT